MQRYVSLCFLGRWFFDVSQCGFSRSRVVAESSFSKRWRKVRKIHDFTMESSRAPFVGWGIRFGRRSIDVGLALKVACMCPLKKLTPCGVVRIPEDRVFSGYEAIDVMPQLQLLYEELDSMIQILFDCEHTELHELKSVKDLKRRFKNTAEEAQDIIDLFVSGVHFRKKGYSPRSDVFKTFLNLDHHKLSGLDHHVEVIRDKLVEDQKQLDVVSIVGMGGLGKTTLATKVFNDRFIMYLIVHDDIWSQRGWITESNFPRLRTTSSRILLTSRLNEVGLHAKSKPSGLVHFLSYLTKKQSWELLCKKVFHGEECPEWLIKHGMQIANKCQGPPLSVVVIAGLLAKEPINRDLWKKIAHSVGSYIATDKNGHMETLDLSYNHLPLHLRDCFLYLGGFPEDFKFPARWLIWLWMAEGFIQEAENQSFEDIGEAYLLDLVGRNLVIVAERKSNGGVKSFKVHDLVRELPLK
ncbi:disease resistance protein [Tanacetum coccineum]